MVRKTGSRKRRVASKGARGYKKCVVSVIKRNKFKTPKQARKVFAKAAKTCRAKVTGNRTVAGKRRVAGKRKVAGKRRKCKYGRLKNGKRCRKTPRR